MSMVEQSPDQWLSQLATAPTGITLDSRRVQAGVAFAALPGGRVDGRGFIGQALDAGAAAVFYEAGDDYRPADELAARGVPLIGVPDLAGRLGELAAAIYGQPSRDLWLVGVTGTNGKTSSSTWVAQALSAVGRQCAVIGTLGNGFPGALADTVNTTPDAATLQGLFRQFKDAGAAAVAMEVSSHALDLGRVAGSHYDVALFTNLTRDHLDFHGDMAAYGASKAKLFAWPGLKTAVINVDDPFGRELATSCRNRGQATISFALDDWTAELVGLDLVCSVNGLRMRVTWSGQSAVLESKVVGGFNASNLLGVLGVLLASGVPFAEAVARVAALPPVTGRMERLGGGSGADAQPLVVVDYAHTPDALAKALSALRPSVATESRLICVFGCGGDRDPGKRPQMGAIAARLADQVIATSDNPRTEDPQKILDGIVAGIPVDRQVALTVEVDRGRAIDAAITAARAGDIVLIAGKGHEPYQEIQGVRHEFSDLDRAAAALSRWRRA